MPKVALLGPQVLQFMDNNSRQRTAWRRSLKVLNHLEKCNVANGNTQPTSKRKGSGVLQSTATSSWRLLWATSTCHGVTGTGDAPCNPRTLHWNTRANIESPNHSTHGSPQGTGSPQPVPQTAPVPHSPQTPPGLVSPPRPMPQTPAQFSQTPLEFTWSGHHIGHTFFYPY